MLQLLPAPNVLKDSKPMWRSLGVKIAIRSPSVAKTIRKRDKMRSEKTTETERKRRDICYNRCKARSNDSVSQPPGRILQSDGALVERGVH